MVGIRILQLNNMIALAQRAGLMALRQPQSRAATSLAEASENTEVGRNSEEAENTEAGGNTEGGT